MTDKEIDLLLARKEELIPSSGFTASVMAAVTREAAAPPPIPFPWKRALPGLGWCLAVIVGLLITGRAPTDNPPLLSALELSAVLGGAGWITAALLVSFLSIALSVRITGKV